MLYSFISNSLEFSFKKKNTKLYKIFILFTCLNNLFGLKEVLVKLGHKVTLSSSGGGFKK